jgi:hypothetical protein
VTPELPLGPQLYKLLCFGREPKVRVVTLMGSIVFGSLDKTSTIT